jgi:hypothetical protein
MQHSGEPRLTPKALNRPVAKSRLFKAGEIILVGLSIFMSLVRLFIQVGRLFRSPSS